MKKIFSPSLRAVHCHPALGAGSCQSLRRPRDKRGVTILFLLLFFLPPPLHAQPIEAQRLNSLLKEIRCVVCQNQNLADSNAPLAKDLRIKIQQMVQENKSDYEIKNYLVKRYGEFILLKPRFNQITLLLWFAPLIILVILISILKVSFT